MLKETIGIIGTGNMGGALARGLKLREIVSAERVLLFDIEKEKLNPIIREFGFSKASSSRELVENSKFIILAVKPRHIPEVLEETAPSWTSDKLLISIAAGIKISFLEQKLKKTLPVVRAMPNTPGQIGAGITAVSFNRSVIPEQRELVNSIFKAFGEVMEVEEEAMDLVTALSGSGPAYFFLFMEGLIEAGETLGLGKNTVEYLIKETASGAAKLAKEAPQSLSQLREKVTSPGGTTEAALKVFNKAKLKETILKAVEAAMERAKELSKNFKNQ